MPRGHLSLVSLALAFLLLFPATTLADKLSITSSPSGAVVEIDGVKVGKTPFVKDYPGGYFHRTKTAIGSRLEHPLVARVTLDGFAPKVVALCDGPQQWRDLHGRTRGEYWTFKVPVFDVILVPISKLFTGEVDIKTARDMSAELTHNLTLEQVVERVKPSVVFLEGSNRSGTGFLVTDSGLIATNAHVAREEESLLAKFSGGVQLKADVAYIDDEVDIALLKADAKGAAFPHLTLGDPSAVHQGQEVLAIGNPGAAMLFSVTKGIVSAVDKFPGAGPGTWIQTDAQINPGNSGGPLVNMKGEVIGITTSKASSADTTGIGFALSVSHLRSILHNFYPDENILTEAFTTQATSDPNTDVTARPAPLSTEPNESAAGAIQRRAPAVDSNPIFVGYGIVDVGGPTGSKVEVDGVHTEGVPASFRLRAGVHKIVVIRADGYRQPQFVHVVANSEVTLVPPVDLTQLPRSQSER